MVLVPDAAQTALVLGFWAYEFVVSVLLPLGDQVLIRPLLAEAVHVELLGYLLLLVVELVDVARTLMVEFQDFPPDLDFPLTFMRLVFGVAHHVHHLEERWLDQFPAFRGSLGSQGSDLGHFINMN